MNALLAYDEFLGYGGEVFWGKSCDSERLTCKKALLAGDALVISGLNQQIFVESLELSPLPRHVEATRPSKLLMVTHPK